MLSGPMAMPGRIAPAQLGLFEHGAPQVAAALRAPRRVALDEASWVEHVPRWLALALAHSERLFEVLRDGAGWERRQRWMYTRRVDEPRLTAEYHLLAEAPFEELRAIGAALSERCGVPYDSVWLNLYRDHQDSTAWHADRPASNAPHSLVPVLSLGATRRFAVRHRDGGRSTVFEVAAGDLVVMGGRCQRDWVHSVPKEQQPAGPRISINFASSVQAAGG
jgi:alkylated DNA repair dioxygenase AlkB